MEVFILNGHIRRDLDFNFNLLTQILTLER